MIRTNLSQQHSHTIAAPHGGFFRDQSGIILFGGLFLLGVALGSCVVAWLDVASAENLLVILNGFIGALIPNAVLLGLLALCGFCAVSAPIIVLIPWFKGLGFGLMASSMLVRYGMPAISYLAALVLPNLVLSGVVLLFASRDTMRMSLSFWRSMNPAHRTGPALPPGVFAARCIFYALFIAAGAAVEAYSFVLFGVFFVL